MERKHFPTAGRFRCPTLPSGYYMSAADARRYRYVTPADGAQSSNWVADCWIVDAAGEINPGTNVSPVPIARTAIGRRIA